MTKPRLDLNASSAARWTTCTASPAFIVANADRIPSSTDTVYNMEGTTAHEVAAALLESRPVKAENCKSEIDGDMCSYGWDYMEYVQSLRAPQSMLLVEQKMELWYMPGRHAIVDAAIINPLDLHVIDYKYGEGIVVHPEGNLQAVIYAFSIGRGYNLSDDFPVFIHIFQPRGRGSEDGAGHVWETTWSEVKAIAKGISETAVIIQGADATDGKYLVFAPSDKACQWCPAKGFCEARQQFLTGEVVHLDAPQELPAPGVLTDEQISSVLTHSGTIVSWLNDVEAYALSRMTEGHSIPGHKLVLSRGGNRYFTDVKKAEELLLKDTILKRHEIVEERLISPAAVEKLIGKNRMSAELTALVAKAPGSPCIAPEADKREAIGGLLDGFEVITES